MGGDLTESIDKAYNAEKPSDYRSSRLGASVIGNPCLAYLSMVIRGFPEEKIPPKLKRIFRDGHRIETSVVFDLKKAGYLVHEKDPMTGKQYMWDRHDGMLVYYADGIIEMPDGECVLLEVKSMKDDLFNTFKNRGLLVSHPKYYDQLQQGMNLSGYKKAILIAYNKNTSEYWDQTIEYDPIKSSVLMYRGERVLMGEDERIAKDQSDWRCKDCPKRALCWDGAPVPQDKRTCKNSQLVSGKWQCSRGCGDTCQHWERYEPTPRQ